MSSTGLFDRISTLVQEVDGEVKAAADKAAMDDPGGHEGPTSHPSKKPDDNEQAPAEGSQSADNTKVVKESVPEAVDSQPEATPGNVPKSDEVQLGQGVDKAKATGEDATNETVSKGKPEGDKKEGDMGGTTHVADGQYGDKYASAVLQNAEDDVLFKMAADLGNEITADIANGHFAVAPKAIAKTAAAIAANAGAAVAEQAGQFEPNKAAADIVADVVKTAHYQADLAADYLFRETDALKKQAISEMEDPTAGGAEGEAHGSENIGGELPPEAMAAMGGPEGAMGGPEGGAAEELLAQMGGGGPEAGPEMGAGEEAGLGAPPEAMGAMGQDEGIQQLAMALLELGIDPAELAAAAADTGAKIASVVSNHKNAGKFRMEEAKTAAQRDARDYMKGYIRELLSRSRR